MEQLIEFNGVTICLTTGSDMNQVQHWLEADVILSVYPGEVQILKGPGLVGGLVGNIVRGQK